MYVCVTVYMYSMYKAWWFIIIRALKVKIEEFNEILKYISNDNYVWFVSYPFTNQTVYTLNWIWNDQKLLQFRADIIGTWIVKFLHILWKQL